MDFMPLRLNSSSLTCSICTLAAIILQLVAIECQNLHVMDLPTVSTYSRNGIENYRIAENKKRK